MNNIFRIIILISALLSPHGGIMAQVSGWSLVGRVVDGDGNVPLQGVTIRTQDGNTSLQSDRDGRFQLRSPSAGISLNFSLVGFRPERVDVLLPATDTLLVRLWQSSELLQEITVSTGYQDIARERVTGSFEQVGPALLNRSVGVDILSRIENVTAAIYFDRSNLDFNASGPPDHRITMHGISTLRGPRENQPLIILDNFPYEGDIANINPNDVENVTVLKDAAASSIWGARAGNGVIVITSKRAGQGGRAGISFDHQTTIRSRPDLFGRNTVGSADLIEVEEFLFRNGYYTVKENDRAKPALPPSVETLIGMRENRLSHAEGMALIGSFGQHDIRNDLLDHVYRNAVHRQYAISLNKGTGAFSSSASVGHDRMENTLRNSSDRRTTARFSTDASLWKGAKLRTNVRWAQTDERRPTNESARYTNLGHPFPYARLMDDAGNRLAIPFKYRMGFLDTAGRGALLDWHYRPLDELDARGTTGRSDELMGNLDFSLSILPWLSADVRYQLQLSGSATDTHGDLDSYATRDRINRGTSITDGGVAHHFPYGAVLRKTQGGNTAHNGRAQLNVNRDWSGRHGFSGMAGFEISQRAQESSTFTAFGFDPATLTYANNVQHGQRYAVFANLAPSESVPYPINSFSEQVNRYVSLFSNSSYTYAGRYTVYASARRDASNLFGVKTNDRWTPLWSIGGAWTASDEPFMRGRAVQFLKFRGSYGVSGNVDNSMSGVTTLIYSNNAASTLVPFPAADIRNPPNPQLRWELVRKLNLGGDVGLFGGRLTGSLDWYVKRTEDLIHTYPLDATTGVASMTMNVANTSSRGLDLRLTADVLETPLKWRAEALFAYNNNWIEKTYLPYNGPAGYIGSGALSALEGTIAYPVYSYRWAGLDPQTGEPRGMLDGVPSTDYRALTSASVTLDQLVFHGSARPLYFGSLRNDFSYRDFSLSFNIIYRLSYHFRRKGLDYQRLFEHGDGHADYHARWRQPGDERNTHVPAMQYPMGQGNAFYQYTEPLIERGDHVRLRDVRLDYAVRKPLAKANARLTVFLYVDNTGIFWSANRLGLDPEVDGNIPVPPSASLGLKLAIQ